METEIKLSKETLLYMQRRVSGPDELIELIDTLFTAKPSGKIHKKFVKISLLHSGLIELTVSPGGRKFFKVAPALWDKVNLNVLVKKEIAAQRKAEYKAKTADQGHPTGRGAKRWGKKNVLELLEASGWNAAEAARKAGVKRQYISFLRHKFGILKPGEKP